MVTPNPLLSPNDPNDWFVIFNHWFVSISDSIEVSATDVESTSI